MADDADTQVLNAAVRIRGELAVLVPDNADALGAALDKHIAKAKAASPADRPVHLDVIIHMLSSHEPTRKRLHELSPIIDADRGAADWWAPDQTLAGEPPNDKKLLSFTCQTCHYVNKRAFRPPADALPDCQNPDVPRHPLKLS